MKELASPRQIRLLRKQNRYVLTINSFFNAWYCKHDKPREVIQKLKFLDVKIYGVT